MGFDSTRICFSVSSTAEELRSRRQSGERPTCCEMTARSPSSIKSHAAFAPISDLNSLSALPSEGALCRAPAMDAVSALTAPKRRLLVRKSSKATSSMLRPNSKSTIKDESGGRYALIGAQSRCSKKRLTHSSQGPISQRAQRKRTRLMAALSATTR